jgi:hypothetical protein
MSSTLYVTLCTSSVIRFYRTRLKYPKQLLFTVLPLIASGTLLPSLLSPSSTPNMRILALLGITSLLATAWICKFVPATSASKKSRSLQPSGFGDFAPDVNDAGPVEKYLIPLTSVITLLLFIAAFGLKGREGREEGFWILCLMPGCVFWVVMVARRIMGSMGIEIGELEGKRYEFKGA